MSAKMTIIEGNSNEKDNVRAYMVKGEKGDTPIALNSYSNSTTESYSSNYTNKLKFFPKNAGAHNSVYRGEDITNLFYNGILSTQIAAETFDDVFVGDYIIGRNSGRKYLVADINYRLYCGDNNFSTPHILMLPEKSLGEGKMNLTNITTGAYIGSEMYTNILPTYRTIIESDFGFEHILQHRTQLQNATNDGYEVGGTWYDSTIELLNEKMVYGCDIFHNVSNGSIITDNYTIDKSQLSLFRFRPDLIVCFNDNEERRPWWLRDVVSSTEFARVGIGGIASYFRSSISHGVRPAFLLY